MTDACVGFRPPCWYPYGWAPAWRLHTNLYKVEKKIFPHISHKKNGSDQNFGESLSIFTFFYFPDSGLYLLTGFDFLFWSILNCVTLKTSNWSFLKTFTVPVTFFPVTSPVSKTFAYFALVLRAHYAICRYMFIVGFQYHFPQKTASFSAGWREQLVACDMLLFWCSWFKYGLINLDLVTVGKFCFHLVVYLVA